MVTRLAKGIAWLPFANLLLLTITLAVSYSISKSRGLILTPLPFISDTGTFPPASCWFTFLLNATAYSVACTGVVRWMIRLRNSIEILWALVRVITFVITEYRSQIYNTPSELVRFVLHLAANFLHRKCRLVDSNTNSAS